MAGDSQPWLGVGLPWAHPQVRHLHPPGGPPHLLSGILNIYKRAYRPFQSGTVSLPYLSLFSAPHLEASLENTNQIMSLPCSKLPRDFLF